MIAGYYGTPGYIQLSVDSGTTWTTLDDSDIYYITGVVASDDFSKMAASCTSNRQIYISTDSGLTWNVLGGFS